MLLEHACHLARQISLSQMRGGAFLVTAITKESNDPRLTDDYAVWATDPYHQAHVFRNPMQWQTWLGPVDDPIIGPGRETTTR